MRMETGRSLFLCALGLALFIEGIPYFIFPHKIKNFFLQIKDLPEQLLRVFGFIFMLSGLLIVYLTKSHGS